MMMTLPSVLINNKKTNVINITFEYNVICLKKLEKWCKDIIEESGSDPLVEFINSSGKIVQHKGVALLAESLRKEYNKVINSNVNSVIFGHMMSKYIWN